MNEAILTALIAGVAGVVVAVVNLLAQRLDRELPPAVPIERLDELVTDVQRLRSGLRRHIITCRDPEDLRELLK
jgi:hypothetical protein